MNPKELAEREVAEAIRNSAPMVALIDKFFKFPPPDKRLLNGRDDFSDAGGGKLNYEGHQIMSEPIKKPVRIEYGLAEEVYRAQPEISKSQTDSIDDCLAKYHRESVGLIERKATPAMRYGTQLHALLLDGTADYHVKPEGMTFASKEGKAWRDDHSDKPILKQEEHDELTMVANRLLQHRHAKPLLLGSKTEVSLFGIHQPTGLLIKGRADLLNSSRHFIADIKSMADASNRAMSRALMDWNYHVQAYWYRELAQQNGHDIKTFYFFGIERKTGLINVRAITESALEQGKLKMDSRLEKLKIAIATGDWPDYSGSTDEPGEIDLPPYAYTDITGAELLGAIPAESEQPETLDIH